MSVRIKSALMKVKNSDGEYVDIDTIAINQTTQEAISEIEETVAGVQDIVEDAETRAATVASTVSAAETAIANLENQKNDIVQSVASMAELGTDTTLTVSGMAADAKATGDAVNGLKSALKDLESDNGVAPNMINPNETWQAKIDDYNTTAKGTVYQVSSNAVTTLTGSDVSAQFGVLINIDDMPDELVIYDDVMQGYSVKLILSSGTELNSSVLVYYSKTNFASQSSNFASFCTKYADHYVLNKAAMLTLYPSTQGIFVNVVASLFEAKKVLSTSGKSLDWLRLVEKNFNNDIVKPSAIDGTEYNTTTITETITTNSYWYATSGGNIASGGARSGMDKAVFDISNMTGKIVFGYDSEADYGSFVCGLSSNSSSPYTRLTYYSKSEIATSDHFSVNENVVTMDLDAIKERYPTAILLFINVPHNVWLLENRVAIRKSLKWLAISGYVPSIVVAKDGSGDYTTISEAVAAAKNTDTIYIKDGEYKETVIVNKYLHLVGESKQGVILYNDVGNYDSAPLSITQGSVCNMTIKSLAPADTSGLADYAYAIHLDKNFASLAKYQKCEIWNCDIYSEVNDAIGAGTNYASEYDIHDCFLHVAHNPVKTGSCGFKCHNGANQTTGKVTLRNNVIITEDANGTTCYDVLYHNGGISNVQPIDVLQVGNVLKYYHNGITNIFVPSEYNYGNSVAEMNTLT